jgi:hypothetical protein
MFIPDPGDVHPGSRIQGYGLRKATRKHVKLFKLLITVSLRTSVYK